MSQLKNLSDFKKSLAARDYEGALASIALFEAGYEAAAKTRDINDFIPSLIPSRHWRRLFLYWKGYCLNRLDRKEEAVAALESLLSDYAPFPEGQNLVGGEHARSRNDALRELAFALLDLGRRGECMALLSEIVADDPRDLSAANALAAMYFEDGRFEEALGAVSGAPPPPRRVRSPDYGASLCHYIAARCRMSLGQAAEAAGHAALALRFDPGSPQAAALVAELKARRRAKK